MEYGTRTRNWFINWSSSWSQVILEIVNHRSRVNVMWERKVKEIILLTCIFRWNLSLSYLDDKPSYSYLDDEMERETLRKIVNHFGSVMIVKVSSEQHVSVVRKMIIIMIKWLMTVELWLLIIKKTKQSRGKKYFIYFGQEKMRINFGFSNI